MALVLALFLSGCGAIGEDGGSPPEAPTALSATSGEGTVTVEWDESEEANAYNVYRSETSRQELPDEPQNSDIGNSTLSDESVENGQTYYYRVTAVNDNGESEPSSEAVATPFPEPPGQPDQ